jgi:glutaredoxin 3
MLPNVPQRRLISGTTQLVEIIVTNRKKAVPHRLVEIRFIRADMAGDARELVKKLIAENNVVVFSGTYCPFCSKAKALLSKLGVKYLAIEIDTREDGDEILEAVTEMTGQETIPNVFIKGRSIGGCDDTHELHREGKLLPLIGSL